MVRPYKTNGEKVDYVGNKLFPKVNDVLNQDYTVEEFENRVKSFVDDSYWEAISKVNNRIFISSTE